MSTIVAVLANKPICGIYLLQAATYVGATVALRFGHQYVGYCYILSAITHVAAAFAYAGTFG